MAKAKKVVAVAVAELFGVELLEANLSQDQIDICESFLAAVVARDIELDSYAEQSEALIRALWPTLPMYEVYQPTRAAFEHAAGKHAAAMFRAAVKKVFGTLPTAGKATTGKTKGMTPKKAAKGLESRTRDVLAWQKSVRGIDIDAKTFAAITKAIAGLVAASEALSRVANA